MSKYIIAIFISLFISSCDHDLMINDLEEVIEERNDSTSNTKNVLPSNDSVKTPLPDKKPNESLKILAIGNSFTDDAMQYLPNLISSAKLPNVKLAKIVVGGTSLQFHYNHALLNDSTYHLYVSEGGKPLSGKGKISFSDALSKDQWDIVVMQQVSQFSGQYNTYQPYLDSLIVFVHRQLPETVIAWQMTWAYGSSSTHSGFKKYDNDQSIMFKAICNSVNNVLEETNIDIIIPSGIAIQKLRETNVNNPPLDLTRDGFHLDYGAGRYTAACTWFEALIAKVFHLCVKGNTYRVNLGNVPVTDENASICQQVAHDAVEVFNKKKQ